MIMDWTGYPRDLDPEDVIDTQADLAKFLADPAEQLFVVELLGLLQDAENLPERAARVAVAFPREVQARGVWLGYTPAPTAAQLLDALVQVPDAPDDTPPQLLPVILQRLQVTAQPNTSASVTMMYRVEPGENARTQQFNVPTPSVDIDPELLTTNVGACLTVRLTMQDDQVPA
jgi:hypothetical protein